VTFTAALLIIATAVGLFLTAVLALTKRTESHILAAFTALLTAISFLQLMVTLRSVFMLYLPFVVFPALFLHGIIIDLYTRRLLGKTVYTRATVLLLCLPAVLALGFQITMFGFFAEFRDVEAVYKQRGLVKIYTAALFVFALGYNLKFIWSSVRKLQAAQMAEQNKNLSALSGKYTWLRLFLIFNAMLCGAGLINVFYNLVADEPAPVNPLTAVLFSGGNYLILAFLIKQPAIFAVSDAAAAETQKGKYAKMQVVDAATRQQYVQRIQQYLSRENALLDDSFGLKQLSEQIGIAPHLISMVINSELQQNFYTLVNSYRVEKAKKLLSEETRPNILEIAYASGFQSKSAFNKVFKQFTGQTPSDFRNPQ
jgi:AraC-like DNA-binding protein